MLDATNVDMRYVLAAFLALHGMVHLLGFLVPWRLIELPNPPPATTAAWGWIELGPVGARILGGVWLLSVLTFGAAAVGIVIEAPWRIAMTATAAALSAILCVAGAPASLAGLAIDIAILIALVGMPGWLVGR